MRLARGLTLALLVAWCLLRAPRLVNACTPPPGGLPSYTTTDRTQAAPIVLEGTVIAMQEAFPQIAVVQATRYLKGIGPETIAISGYGPTSVCLSPVSVGQAGIFYVSGDEATGYSAYYHSQFDAVAPNDPQTVEEVIAASGQTPRTDFLPYQPGTADAVMTQAMSGAMLTATAAFPLTPTPLPYGPPVVSPPLAPTPVANLFGEQAALLGTGVVIGVLIGIVLGVILSLGAAALLRRRS